MSIEALHDSRAARAWVVVTQVKSHRVVYFTDDSDYEPPMHGDWYYVSPYEGALPPGMTLRNCWRWRFNGMDFVAAAPDPAAHGEASLLASNKRALLELLGQRIDALRRPLEPSSLAGIELRARKLAEARAVLGGSTEATPMLSEAAAARLCTVEDMARRIVALDHRRNEVLLASEREREAIAATIERATTQEQLMQLRARILEEVEVGDVEPAKLKQEHATPEQLDKPLSARQLADEQLRLRLQLRNRINALRRPFVSQYLLDDLVLGRKVEIAIAVSQAGGALPAGVDGALLISHAALRGQGVAEAAREVLDESRQMREVLLTTERMKDAVLARIAAAATLAHLHGIGRSIEEIGLEKDASSANGLREVA